MTKLAENSAALPRGFSAAGVAAGIKSNGKPDTALIVSDRPAHAAGVFTTNAVKAASVKVSRRHLADGAPMRAIVFTSGNANASTGEAGYLAAQELCRAAAAAIGCDAANVLIGQTGLIGKPFSAEIGAKGVMLAAGELSPGGAPAAARAMMTTDTKPKLAFSALGDECGSTMTGLAKGAAMLCPSMATMLAAVVTDADADAAVLRRALEEAVSESFHMMIVDGCRSTNDTVVVLANGASGAPKITAAKGPRYDSLVRALTEVCTSLAMQMAGDAEGATKFFKVHVRNAATREDARLAARGVVGSALVKCSLAGEVAYWGRVISELGASGAVLDPDTIDIAYGPYTICRASEACENDECAVEAYLKNRELAITCDLHCGSFEATAYGCDLTHGYVDENMGKS
jgi:glutamate N-acetyltransferase/amino-acid N-acetyltransferase